jgi:hypothetical protein
MAQLLDMKLRWLEEQLAYVPRAMCVKPGSSLGSGLSRSPDTAGLLHCPLRIGDRDKPTEYLLRGKRKINTNSLDTKKQRLKFMSAGL